MSRTYQVELLAPAGNYESFLGAIHAGADAVYIGGKKYGARAYADNFSDEEVCLAIRYAHLLGRKIYLTVNTLVRQEELADLPEYLRPFYEEGLDGIIVQDFGVFHVVRELFPELELHVSTQMTVTGVYGAKLLKEQGAARVVPARELSLEEIRAIRQEADIQVEAFIHGAMCYCYSGQCLFSSMLGGRSGNRGRCAQPCRLPYTVTGIGRERQRAGKESYPLSLKDMCTLSILPELIEAGIDSFKIEGRMKSPEYAAGVTALYRKYIDRYLAAPDQPWKVEPDDMERLKHLYIRSEIQEGYYHRYNGREMITPDKPSYCKADERYLQEIRNAWLEQSLTLPVYGRVILCKNRPVMLELCTERKGDPLVRTEGIPVLQAVKQPLTAETVEKQIRKTGGTAFVFEELICELEPDCFLPVKALNDLRRDALRALEDKLLSKSCRKVPADYQDRLEQLNRELISVGNVESTPEYEKTYIAVMIDHDSQFDAVEKKEQTDRLYLESECMIEMSKLSDWKQAKKGRLLFAAMPRILRSRDKEWLAKFNEHVLKSSVYDGVLIRNLESLFYLKEQKYDGMIQADSSLYIWNSRAKKFLTELGVSQTAPGELNRGDWHAMGIRGTEVEVYGRTPLMVTANCVRKTAGECLAQGNPGQNVSFGRHESGERLQGHGPLWLTDRYQVRFPVHTVCEHCYNVLYNSVPLSLHGYGKSICLENPSGIRLSFTTETPEEIRQVFCRFSGFFREVDSEFSTGKEIRPDDHAEYAFTKGHYKRGAE